jgi:hypothetical protein
MEEAWLCDGVEVGTFVSHFGMACVVAVVVFVGIMTINSGHT